MVFNADIAIALALLAMGFGYWIIRAVGDGAGTNGPLGKGLGYFILIYAFLVLICASYYSLKYWEAGHYAEPTPVAMSVMPHAGMMGDMSMCKPPGMGMRMDACKMGQGMDHDAMMGKSGHDHEGMMGGSDHDHGEGTGSE